MNRRRDTQTSYTYEPLPGSRTANGHRRVAARHVVVYAGVLILLLISNLYLTLMILLGSPWDCVRPQLVFTPAKDAIRYEVRTLRRDIEHNPFAGPPSPEHDQAWAKLIEPITIKISQDELGRVGNDSSIALRDGSGYIAETALYHELHCIKRIRRHLYFDHYYPDITEDELLREGPHIDHCLEYWREAAMCRGDMTISTFAWLDNKPFSRVYSTHECANWDDLDSWARKRMVDMSDYSILDVKIEDSKLSAG